MAAPEIHAYYRDEFAHLVKDQKDLEEQIRVAEEILANHRKNQIECDELHEINSAMDRCGKIVSHELETPKNTMKVACMELKSAEELWNVFCTSIPPWLPNGNAAKEGDKTVEDAGDAAVNTLKGLKTIKREG